MSMLSVLVHQMRTSYTFQESKQLKLVMGLLAPGCAFVASAFIFEKPPSCQLTCLGANAH